MQVVAVHFSLRPIFPQQVEPMASYKPAPLGRTQILHGARMAVAPAAVLLLLGMSRIKLALQTEMFLKYKVY